MIEYNRHFLLVGLIPRVVWTVRWWSGVVVCFVQLPTLVCSVLQSIPYQGVVLPILFSLNSILGHCFVYVSFMMFWVVLMVFLLCSVTCCSVLCCCSDDVRPLLIGVFELRIGVNSNTPFDSQSCIHRCWSWFGDPSLTLGSRRYAWPERHIFCSGDTEAGW